jgi:hypothetical protein
VRSRENRYPSVSQGKEHEKVISSSLVLIVFSLGRKDLKFKGQLIISDI